MANRKRNIQVKFYVTAEEKELMEQFICEVVSLIRVHEVFSDALESIAAKIFEES